MAMEETAAPVPTVEAIVAKAVKLADGEKGATKAAEGEKTVENGESGVAKVENGDAVIAKEENGEKEVADAGEPVADVNVAVEDLSAKIEAIPSFKAESNFISDLKEPERKALCDLKQRIDAAIKSNEFALPTVEVKVEKVIKTEIVVPVPVPETKAVDATECKPARQTSSPAPVGEKDLTQPVATSTETTAPGETPASETPVTEETPATELAITEKTTAPSVVSAPEATLSETVTTPTPKAAVDESVPAPEAAVASSGGASATQSVPVAEAEVAKAFVPEAPPAVESTEAQEETLKEVPDCPVAAPATSVAELVPATATKEAVVATFEVAKETVIELKDGARAEDISLWGVPLSGPKCDERTDVILLKFLRARDFKVNDAFIMLRNTIWWRKTYKVDTILEEDLGLELDSYFYMHGTDKQGHPVCYDVYGAFQDKGIYQKTFGDAAKIDRFLRWRIQVVERGIQQLTFKPDGPSSILQITDLKSVPVFKKELRSVTSDILNILQDNYPELVEKNVFLNMPWYFSALYSFVSPILTQRTKSKFVVARAGQVPAYLFKYIAHVNVPAQYGGLARPNDTDFSEMDASVKELTLKAGEKETIVIPLESAGSTVVWDFSVNGGDINYGVQFTPSATESYDSIIEKTRKIEEPVRNTFKSTEAGKLVLTADNSSRKKKFVIYRYGVKTPGVVGQE